MKSQKSKTEMILKNTIFWKKNIFQKNHFENILILKIVFKNFSF